MRSDRNSLIAMLRSELCDDRQWSSRLSEQQADKFTLHLAVLREPYLQYILEGKKTIETRFAKRACPPFKRVKENDVVLLKRTPGDVIGVCVVESAAFYQLDPKSVGFIRENFGGAICASPSFWEERKEATVATLITIKDVRRILPLKIKKRDRRGWVIIHDDQQTQLL